MKEKIINHKKELLIGGAILLLAIVAIGSFVFLFGNNQEKLLKDYLKEMGTDFYENLYYQQVGKDDEERKKFLNNFKDLGIKVSLDSLSRYKSSENKEKIDAFVNKSKNQDCDKNNTKVIIYPTDPYGQKDYRMELQLECGFE